jgi:hypothetical protein
MRISPYIHRILSIDFRMIGLKNENEELGDLTYDYILAIKTLVSIYLLFDK